MLIALLVLMARPMPDETKVEVICRYLSNGMRYTILFDGGGGDDDDDDDDNDDDDDDDDDSSSSSTVHATPIGTK